MIPDDGVKVIVLVESLYEQVPVITTAEELTKLKHESVAIRLIPFHQLLLLNHQAEHLWSFQPV
jgi:hypothetical protein